MLPKWHVFWGIIFILVFKIISSDTGYVSLFLIWFASVFIDFDHYLSTAINTGKWGLRHAIEHNYNSRQQMVELKKEQGLCTKGEFHVFHTIELHLLAGIIGIFFAPFFFIFIGMILHSILDLIWMVWYDVLDSREFFLISRLRVVLF